MDEGLRRLERESLAAPGDERAARRHEQVLQRIGQRDAVRRRYTLKFVCPLRFEELSPTPDPLVRRCGRCERTVHFVRTSTELADRVAAGTCVAFERRALAPAIDLVVEDPRTHSAAERGRPCVVPTDMPYVDLDLVDVDAVLDVVSYEVARTYWVFPLAIVGDELQLALGDPSAEHVVHDLSRLLELPIRPVLAAPDAVERAIERHRFHVRWQGGVLLGRLGW